MMNSNPEKALELMEKGIKEEMLGIYDIDLMKKYSIAIVLSLSFI